MKRALFLPITQIIILTSISHLIFQGLYFSYEKIIMLNHVIFKDHFRSKIVCHILILSQLFPASVNCILISYTKFIVSSKKNSLKLSIWKLMNLFIIFNNTSIHGQFKSLLFGSVFRQLQH